VQQKADLKLRVEGHTDNQGSAAANQSLSEKRAQAVVAWLSAHDVPAGRLTAKGLGQAQPVADNSTEDGRAKNRRVELVKQ
jgi:outer membrane protein OmpA-like peptidoglycan-associated protein